MNKLLPAALTCACLAACGRQTQPRATLPKTAPTQGSASEPSAAAAPAVSFPLPGPAPSNAGPAPAAWTAPLIASLGTAEKTARKSREKQQDQAAAAVCAMRSLQDALQTLPAPPINTPPPPDLVAKRQKIEAELAAAKAQFEAAQAAQLNHTGPAAFNDVQAQLRRALARNQLKAAETLLADFKDVKPTPSADQWGALQNDLDIFAKRGGEPFRAGLKD